MQIRYIYSLLCTMYTWDLSHKNVCTTPTHESELCGWLTVVWWWVVWSVWAQQAWSLAAAWWLWSCTSTSTSTNTHTIHQHLLVTFPSLSLPDPLPELHKAKAKFCRTSPAFSIDTLKLIGCAVCRVAGLDYMLKAFIFRCEASLLVGVSVRKSYEIFHYLNIDSANKC